MHFMITFFCLFFLVLSVAKDFQYNQTFTLKRDRDQSFSSETLSFSFIDGYRRTLCRGGEGRIVIHNPSDSPTIEAAYQKSSSFFSVKHLTQIKVTPIITTTEDELRSMSVDT